jgi:hypothetical protein
MAPLGALLGGWLGEAAGPRPALLAAAMVTYGAFLYLLRSPVRQFREPPATMEALVPAVPPPPAAAETGR